MSFSDVKSINETSVLAQYKDIKFAGFGCWIESLSEVNELLSYMQKAVNIATNHEYTVKEVRVSGGVHELDTGHESFSSKTYSSFEEAKENLPSDFEKEEAKLDGLWLNTLNFEVFAVELLKDDVSFSIIFSRGNLCVPEDLWEDMIKADWTGQDFIIEDSVLKKYQGPLVNVVIPDNVIAIDEYSFEECKSVSSVIIGNNVKTIGEGAFFECKNLKSVKLPESITILNANLFLRCTSLKEVEIPDNVTNIDVCAFLGCESISSITIPNNVVNIAPGAFGGCKNLTSITIPDSVVCLENWVFKDCDNLNNVNISNDLLAKSENAFPVSVLSTIRRNKGLCQHCGGEFKKRFFSSKCRICGKRKDY